MDKDSSIDTSVLLEEEIVEYYKNQNEKSENTQNTEKKFSFDINMNDSLIEEIYEFPPPRQSKLLFCSACLLVGTVAVCTMFCLGMNKSADRESAEFALGNMRYADVDYLMAEEENEQLKDEVKKLSEQALDLNEKYGDISNYDNAKDLVLDKLNQAKEKFQTKNDNLYNINQEIKGIKEADGNSNSIVLTPGVYSVGKNIPEGKYNVTSEGTIATSLSGESKDNLPLAPQTAVSVELKNGYTLKINATTTFELAQ